ncbi:MAG: hypothetical protein J7J99_02265, partial [Thermoprotei archaeon]|nr:hypothetical protein [Thermoprotei archaeon]
YARLYPIIVTLYEEPITIYEGLPIVPIAKFNNFLQSFDVWSDSLLSIPVKFMKRGSSDGYIEEIGEHDGE